jgi:hypothetical protein
MSAGELAEHLQYWQDEEKIDGYRRALAEVIRPGDTVLDLGAGTGLLGLLACEAGAGHVLAVENGPIATVTRGMIQRNGLADRVEVRQTLSTTLEDDVPFDVIVGDQIGGFVFSAGVLRFYADASRRLLRPGGTLVPSRFDLLLAPVEHDPSRRAIDGWRDHPSGYDLSAVHELAPNAVRHVTLDEDALLAAARPVGTLAADDDRRFRATLDVEVERPGRLDGVAGMFVAHLSPSSTITNVPGAPHQLRHRWQDLFPLRDAIDVAPGDRVEAEVVVDPVSYLTVWTLRVTTAAGVQVGSHSTFEGSLFDPAWFRIVTGRPVAIGELAREAVRAIAGTSGPIDASQVVTEVRSRVPDAPATQVERLVRSLTTLLADGPGEPQA